MKCPYQIITTKRYGDNHYNDFEYGKETRITNEFAECCEEECTFFERKEMRRFSDASLKYDTYTIKHCKRTDIHNNT